VNDIWAMFTGIIESTGHVYSVITDGSNKTFWVASPISNQLSIDQSVSHNGVCLTVEEIKDDMHRVTAIDETLNKTNLGSWEEGCTINLERCMQMNGRLDGHIVQGHVDTTAVCNSVTEKDGSWEYSFETDKKFAGLMIEKGSISLNGISLTIFNVNENGFSVAIIPYTYEHTNMQNLQASDKVNIEFDMIGKYVSRLLQLKG
jgi:riboflavin synthase